MENKVKRPNDDQSTTSNMQKTIDHLRSPPFCSKSCPMDAFSCYQHRTFIFSC
uniref:Uncharacterized protein n=1 Tax=Arundo donax TaxID=35708 RepID=A0A0A9ARS0_ARUDO